MFDATDHVSCYLNGGATVSRRHNQKTYPVRIYTETLILHLQPRDLPTLENAVSELRAVERETNDDERHRVSDSERN